MGQSLKKLTPAGSEEKKDKEIAPIIEKHYKTYLAVPESDPKKAESQFYQAVSEIIGEINKTLGSTQFRVPSKDTLKEAYDKHRDKKVTEEEFQKILQEVIVKTGISGRGATDIILYIFGVPVTALFIKQGIFPRVVPNEFFIPAVTSATVFVLAKLNKI